MDKKIVAFSAGLVCVGVLIGALIMYSFSPHVHYFFGSVGVDFETGSIHSRIRIWQGDKLILDEYHSGVVTNIGDNMTLYKMFGSTNMQYADLPYMDNCTFISIGNYTNGLDSTITVLPNEWNRTAGAIEDEGPSCLNITCTFYPDAGPNTANCIGLNLNNTASANNLLFYDTFTKVSGIDETFTIFEPSPDSDV